MRMFNHTKPVRNADGTIIGQTVSPVRAKTVNGLGYNHGPDKNKRLIVSLEAGDVIGIRVERTARKVTILAVDLYAYCLRMQANKATLEKARDRKAKKAIRLAAQRQARAEKKLFAK